MNGPDHYKAAERLLETAVTFVENNIGRADTHAGLNALNTGADRIVALAAVHASLAQTAAYADANLGRRDEHGDHFHPDWVQAVSS